MITPGRDHADTGQARYPSPRPIKATPEQPAPSKPTPGSHHTTAPATGSTSTGSNQHRTTRQPHRPALTPPASSRSATLPVDVGPPAPDRLAGADQAPVSRTPANHHRRGPPTPGRTPRSAARWTGAITPLVTPDTPGSARTQLPDPARLATQPNRVPEALLATVLSVVANPGPPGATAAPSQAWVAAGHAPGHRADRPACCPAVTRPGWSGRVPCWSPRACLPMMSPSMAPVTLVVALAVVVTYPGPWSSAGPAGRLCWLGDRARWATPRWPSKRSAPARPT